MALLSLLYSRPRKMEIKTPTVLDDGQGGERELLILDAAEEIAHTNEVELTDNPVEEGVDVSDHADIKPKILSFNGIVSEAPIKLEQAIIGNVAGASGGVVGNVAGSAAGALVTTGLSVLGGLLLNQNGNRAQDAMNALLELQAKAIPVTIMTGLRDYKNMILTQFSPVEAARNGKSLVFTATFREIRIVSSEQVVLPNKVLDPSVGASGASNINQGKKVAPEANEQVSGRGSSALSNILGVGA